MISEKEHYNAMIDMLSKVLTVEQQRKRNDETQVQEIQKELNNCVSKLRLIEERERKEREGAERRREQERRAEADKQRREKEETERRAREAEAAQYKARREQEEYEKLKRQNNETWERQQREKAQRQQQNARPQQQQQRADDDSDWLKKQQKINEDRKKHSATWDDTAQFKRAPDVYNIWEYNNTLRETEDMPKYKEFIQLLGIDTNSMGTRLVTFMLDLKKMWPEIKARYKMWMRQHREWRESDDELLRAKWMRYSEIYQHFDRDLFPLQCVLDLLERRVAMLAAHL